MKNILLSILLLFSLGTAAQVQQIGAPNVRVNAKGGLSADSNVFLPIRDTTDKPTIRSAIRIRTQDSLLYHWNGTKWRAVGSVNLVAGFGLTINGNVISGDSSRLATFLRLYKVIDSLTERTDTMGFYRIPGIDSIYLEYSNELSHYTLAVKDSIRNYVFKSDGVIVPEPVEILDVTGPGVVSTKSGNTWTLFFPNTGGGGGGSDGNNFLSSTTLDVAGLFTMNRVGLPALTQTFTTSYIPEGSNPYFTNARARSALSATVPILYNNTTGVFSAQYVTAEQDGVLGFEDFLYFSGKQDKFEIFNQGFTIGVLGPNSIDFQGNQVFTSNSGGDVTVEILDVTASNGLTKTGLDFGLGGTLTTPTNILIPGNNSLSLLGDSADFSLDKTRAQFQYLTANGNWNGFEIRRVTNTRLETNFWAEAGGSAYSAYMSIKGNQGIVLSSGVPVTSTKDSIGYYTLDVSGVENGVSKVSSIKVDPTALILTGGDSVVIGRRSGLVSPRLVYSVASFMTSPLQVTHKYYVDSLNALMQRKILWQSAGVAQGAAGDATTINVTGGATASLSGNTLTIDVDDAAGDGNNFTETVTATGNILTTTRSGLADLTTTIPNIYTTDGTLTGSRTVSVPNSSIFWLRGSANVATGSGTTLRFRTSSGTGAGATDIYGARIDMTDALGISNPGILIATSTVTTGQYYNTFINPISTPSTASILMGAVEGTKSNQYIIRGDTTVTYKPLKYAIGTIFSGSFDSRTLTHKGYVDSVDALLHRKIQFQSAGVNQGAVGAATTINFTGALSASISGSTLTVTSAGGGSGEVNTASNLGAGTGIFGSKVGVDLRFKSLIAGTGISISNTSTDITINSTASAVVAEQTTIANSTFYQFAYASSPGSGLLGHVLRVGQGSVDPNLKTITVNAVLYVQNTSLTTGSWVSIGAVPTGYRPNGIVTFALPLRVDGTQYTNSGAVGFTGTSTYTEATGRILANGEIEVYVTGPSYASLGGLSYAILPIHVTYFYVPGS